MKSKKQNTPSYKDQHRSLERIELQLKSKTQLESVNDTLSKTDPTKLSPKDFSFYLYLNARYFICLFRKENDIEHLEYANDFLDQMMTAAYEDRHIIKESRFLFTRAHVKFQLANLVWDEDRKPWLYDKTKKITNTVLRFNPDNSSFIWLQQQLAS